MEKMAEIVLFFVLFIFFVIGLLLFAKQSITVMDEYFGNFNDVENSVENVEKE